LFFLVLLGDLIVVVDLGNHSHRNSSDKQASNYGTDSDLLPSQQTF
jgi:hypothetical protein